MSAVVLENVIIISVVPPHNDNDMDVKLWPWNSMGGFTVAETYRRIAGFHMHHDLQSWKQIWRIESAGRVKVFLWQDFHDRLLNNWRMARWNLKSPYCSYCGHLEETTCHVLRDFPLANIIWSHLVDIQHRGSTVWSTTCFWIWKWRNARVHNTNLQEPW
ncbi:hypothetical protein TSUD_193840 [Trifolium subterraneum]|uniref:Reverse transcriptase zinc-binding domain-containing protein n=1 Tax=Trifolium subterraneum TaxID=3900 RepID=A0A2Z6MLE6_TRISU|nr:hypothetical protein TSUD_193840 [Trifolium subterraneum]